MPTTLLRILVDAGRGYRSCQLRYRAGGRCLRATDITPMRTAPVSASCAMAPMPTVRCAAALAGRHNVRNACAAAAIATACWPSTSGRDPGRARVGQSRCPGRLQPSRAWRGDRAVRRQLQRESAQRRGGCRVSRDLDGTKHGSCSATWRSSATMHQAPSPRGGRGRS